MNKTKKQYDRQINIIDELEYNTYNGIEKGKKRK